jgi:hypothetical protein
MRKLIIKAYQTCLWGKQDQKGGGDFLWDWGLKCYLVAGAAGPYGGICVASIGKWQMAGGGILPSAVQEWGASLTALHCCAFCCHVEADKIYKGLCSGIHWVWDWKRSLDWGE